MISLEIPHLFKFKLINSNRSLSLTLNSARPLKILGESANDAATVIAESLADSEIIFAQLMTKKAHSLGMRKTIFKNATGLPNRRQKSTAYDIAILSQALINNHSKYYSLNYNLGIYLLLILSLIEL